MRTRNLFVIGLLTSSADICAQEPNLIVIITDEHNFRTLGCYRNTLDKEAAEPWGEGSVVETPNIDYLANEGVICTNFYATNPVSSPSRSSLVSGMYPENTGVVKNDLHMNDNIVTFAQTFKENGYKTGYAGKWHLDGPDKPGWAPKAKFGFDDNKYMFNRGHWKVLDEDKNGPKVATLPNGKEAPLKTATDKTFTTDFLTDRAVEFIKKNSKNKFCYMLSIPDPHTPNTVREPYRKMYENMKFKHPVSAKSDIPNWLVQRQKETIIDKNGMAGYWGMVKCIDDNIGKIINCLKEENILDNTIIVFTADHGDMLGEHSKDNKGVALEASSKVPLIIYHKKGLKKGSIVDKAMNNADFTPTIISLAGLKSDVKYDGRDCSNIIRTNQIPENWENMAVFSHNGWIACTNGEYKLICKLNAKNNTIDKCVEPVLFNTTSDPLEMKNIYNEKKNNHIVVKLYNKIVKHCKIYKRPKV